MSPVLLVIALVAVAASGTVVALTPDPARQAVTLSVHGLLLATVFMLVAAPDVALSQIAVGTVLVPLLVMLTVRAVRSRGEGVDEARRGAAADRAEGDPR